MINIPQRAKSEADYPQLKKTDKQIIAAAVLLQLDNQPAFALYHPEYVDENGKLNAAGKQASKMFWGYGKVKDYREAYEKDVQEFLGIGRRMPSAAQEQGGGDRRDKAEGIYRNKVYTAIETVDPTDIDSMKTVGDLGKTVKIFKEEEEKVEPPRRYLPETCSQCRYKKFIDAHVAGGEIAVETDDIPGKG